MRTLTKFCFAILFCCFGLVTSLYAQDTYTISGTILDDEGNDASVAYLVLMQGSTDIDATYASHGRWGSGGGLYTFEDVPAGDYHIVAYTPSYSNMENRKAVTVTAENIVDLKISMQDDGAKIDHANFLWLRVKEAGTDEGLIAPEDFTYQFGFGENGDVDGPTEVLGGDTYDAFLFFLGEAEGAVGDLTIKVTYKDEVYPFTVTPEQYSNWSGQWPVTPTYVADLPGPDKQTINFTLNGHIGYRDPENYSYCVSPMGPVRDVFKIKDAKVQIYAFSQDDALCIRWDEGWQGPFCAEYPKIIFGEALTNAEGAFTLEVSDSAFIRYPRVYRFQAIDTSGASVHVSDLEDPSNYAEIYNDEDLENLKSCDIGIFMALPEFPVKDLSYWQDARKKAVELSWQLDDRSKNLKVASVTIERYVLDREYMSREYTYENTSAYTESDGYYTFIDQGNEDLEIPSLEYEKTYSYALTITYVNGTRTSENLRASTEYEKEDWKTLQYPSSALYFKVDYTALPTAKDQNTLIVVENETKGGIKEAIFYLAPKYFENPETQKSLFLNAEMDYSIYVYAAGASAKKKDFKTPVEGQFEEILFTLAVDENSNLLEVAVYNDLRENMNKSASVEGDPAFLDGGLALMDNTEPFEDIFPSKHIYVVKKGVEYTISANVPFYKPVEKLITFSNIYNEHEFTVDFDTERMVPTWLKLNNEPGSGAQRVSNFAYQSIEGKKMAVQHIPSGRIFEADTVLIESGIVSFKGLPYNLEGAAEFMPIFPSKNVGFENAEHNNFIIPPEGDALENQLVEGKYPVNSGQAMRMKFTGFTLKATIDHGIGSSLFTDKVRISIIDTVTKKHLLQPVPTVETSSVEFDGINYALKNSDGVMAIKVTFNAQAFGSKDTIVLIDNTNDNFSCDGNVLDLGLVKMTTENFWMQVSPLGVFEQTTSKSDVGIKDVSVKMYKQGDFTTALEDPATSDENGAFAAFEIKGNPISKYTAVFSHTGYISDTISDLSYDVTKKAIEIQKVYLKEAPMPLKYTLTIMASTGGTVEIVGKTGTTLEMLEGEKVSVKATAAEKFEFVNWTSGSTELSTTATYEFTMEAVNTTLTANFLSGVSMQVSPLGVYEKTTSKADVGIKDVSLKMYKQGDFATVLATATSDANGAFTAFEITGTPNSKYTAVFSHADYISDTLTNLSYDATKKAIEIQKVYLEEGPVSVKYTLTIMAGTGGTAEIVGKTGTTLEMIKGEKVSVKATAAEKFNFVNWTSGSTELSTTATYEFTMDTLNTTLTANFLEVSIDADVFAAISIYSQNGTLYISGINSSTRVEIIDALGRRLENTIANGDFSAALPKSGIYMIRLSDAKGIATRKVMVR